MKTKEKELMLDDFKNPNGNIDWDKVFGKWSCSGGFSEQLKLLEKEGILSREPICHYVIIHDGKVYPWIHIGKELYIIKKQ